MASNQKMRVQDVDAALEKMLNDFLHASYEKRQEAVQAGAEVIKTALEQNAPTDSGELKQSFAIKTKYPNHRYVGNTKTVSGKGADGRHREGIPLLNILEYRQGGTPFVRNTFEANEQKAFEAIKNKLNN